MFTPGYARFLVLSLTTAAAGVLAYLPWGWFEGS